MSAPALRSVVRMAMDRPSGMAEVLLSGGTFARMPLGGTPFHRSSRLVRVEFLPGLAVLRATTDAGDQVEYDLPGPDGPVDPLAGRPVVYLARTSGLPCLTRSTAMGAPRPRGCCRGRVGWRWDAARVVLPEDRTAGVVGVPESVSAGSAGSVLWSERPARLGWPRWVIGSQQAAARERDRRPSGWELLIVLAVFPAGGALTAVGELARRAVGAPGGAGYLPVVLADHPLLAVALDVPTTVLEFAPALLVGYLLALSGGGLRAVGLDLDSPARTWAAPGN